ncbi:hypothetical protein JOB18_004523 [Solea senegalensis]|uniref:Uncharacterized protein n=1 Tax=Solea senegalensis TaxID=28829 RepID=A0AAV6S8Z9_SOLSE|nr:hypothetical protein JOB18_004523 [Solea senegalensis]
MGASALAISWRKREIASVNRSQTGGHDDTEDGLRNKGWTCPIIGVRGFLPEVVLWS